MLRKSRQAGDEFYILGGHSFIVSYSKIKLELCGVYHFVCMLSVYYCEVFIKGKFLRD